MSPYFKKIDDKNDPVYKNYHLLLLIALSLLLYFSASTPARAIIWPTIDDIRITECELGPEGPCSNSLYYSGKVEMREQGEPSVPVRPAKSRLEIVGIHCYYGGNGKPLRTCSWWNIPSHHPMMITPCNFADDLHWDIKDATQCTFETRWGPHTGAGPGGECVMAGVLPQGKGLLYTPWGALDATVVANTGARNCAQPMAPEEGCSVGTLQSLIHGALGPTANDIRTTYTSVSCGLSPKVTIVGGSTLNLGPGVSTTLTAKIEEQRLAVRSDLTITGAKPGSYSGQAIIMVSPD